MPPRPPGHWRPNVRPDAREAIHAALVAVVAWLGAVLALPGATFPTSVSYRYMALLAPEHLWAAAFAVAAGAGLWGLLTRRRVVRLLSVLLLSTVHGVVALCFACANPLTTASGTYAVLASLGYYLAWRRCCEGVGCEGVGP